MTDIEVRQAGAIAPAANNDSAIERLGRWLQQADAVFAIAQKVCSTSFAPAAYRGKPDEAAAAMLAGAELGFDPMASLRAFDNIQGIPAPKALTLRAVVLAQGHKVVIEESTPERAVVRGRRREDDEWQISVWDLDRARKLDLLKKDQWQKQPQAMLVARATAEVCRWIASDAIMGMPYAAEEIGDQAELPPAPVARRLTMADLDAEPEIPTVEATAQVSRDQQKHIFALWGELGLGDKEKRHERLMATAEILGLPDLETFNDLTAEQGDRVIAELRARKAASDE